MGFIYYFRWWLSVECLSESRAHIDVLTSRGLHRLLITNLPPAKRLTAVKWSVFKFSSSTYKVLFFKAHVQTLVESRTRETGQVVEEQPQLHYKNSKYNFFFHTNI